MNQQIAEKFHALTRVYPGGAVSRIKDIIDILLIAASRSLGSAKLRNAINLTFMHRNTHPVPLKMPSINPMFSKDYARLAKEVGLIQSTLEEGVTALETFLLPVISTKSRRKWHYRQWMWE